jgi:hypothetical protein
MSLRVHDGCRYTGVEVRIRFDTCNMFRVYRMLLGANLLKVTRREPSNCTHSEEARE